MCVCVCATAAVFTLIGLHDIRAFVKAQRSPRAVSLGRMHFLLGVRLDRLPLLPLLRCAPSGELVLDVLSV